LEAAAETIGCTKPVKKKGWISTDTLTLTEAKRKAKTHDPGLYKQLKSEVQKKVWEDKQKHLDKACDEMEEASQRGNLR